MSFKYFLLQFLLLGTFLSKGQDTLAHFDISSKTITNIQAFDADGQTLLLFDEKERKTKASVKRLLRLDEHGAIDTLHGSFPEKALMRGADYAGDDLFLYYLDESRKNSLLLRAAVYESENRSFNFNVAELEISGIVLAIWTAENLNILSYDKEQNELRWKVVSGMKLISDQRFVSPIDLTPYYREMRFIQKGIMATVAEGSATSKLYHQGQSLYITIDQNKSEIFRIDPQTVILRFDSETGTASLQRINSNSSNKFSSFLFEGKIYRGVWSKKSYEIKVFDLAQKKLVSTIRFKKDTFLRDSPFYRYDIEPRRLERKGTLLDALKGANYALPALVIYSERDSVNTFIAGTHASKNGAVAPIGNFGFVASLIVLAVRSSMLESPYKDGISYYFYFQAGGDGKQLPVRRRVDDHEAELWKRRVRFGFKGYIDKAEGLIGVYIDERWRKLTLLHFQ